LKHLSNLGWRGYSNYVISNSLKQIYGHFASSGC
jgi:hypothetical protein